MPAEVVRAPNHNRARSLGWLAARWIEHFCVHGPGDIQGAPLNIALPGAIPLSDELVKYTADVYALDENGRRLYDSAFYSRPKGADKSGHSARIALFEAFGPCRFAGWAEGGEVFEWMDFRHVYEPGEPMGRPIVYPFIRILATEEGQTGNVYDAIHYNLTEGPLMEAFSRKDDVGLTRVYLPGGGEIRPSTASSSAKDGGKETHVNFDETHLYMLPELKRMYATVRRNMAKRKDAEPWSNETSTMYEPGALSVAEDTHELAKKIREGRVKRARLLFDHREAPADTDLEDEESLKAGLREAYGDAASYMDLDRLVAEIWDSRNDVTDSRRYFLNQVTAAYDAWIRPDQWDRLADRVHLVPDGAEVVLGFDGSKSDDHTALIGCEVETGHLFPIGIWPPEKHGGEVPREVVDEAVAGAFKRYDVVGFYADLRQFEAYIDEWNRRYGASLCVGGQKNRVAWDMSSAKAATAMIEAFHSAIIEGEPRHPDLGAFSQYFYNARRRPNPHGVTVGKPDQRHKIDAAVAAALAWQCRRDYLALPDGKRRKRRTGRAMSVS